MHVEKQPFKWVENYFTDAILYQKEPGDGNEVDSELNDGSDKA